MSLKAFKKVHPPKDYIEVSKDIVYYANGLPLAIEILGSFLFIRSIDKWKSTLNKLPHAHRIISEAVQRYMHKHHACAVLKIAHD